MENNNFNKFIFVIFIILNYYWYIYVCDNLMKYNNYENLLMNKYADFLGVLYITFLGNMTMIALYCCFFDKQIIIIL